MQSCFVLVDKQENFNSFYCLVCRLVNEVYNSCLSVFECSGLEVIKLEFILRLKIKRNDWLLADTCKQPIISLYFDHLF